MGLLLDGVAVGAPAAEAPALHETLREIAALATRDQPRELHGASDGDAARMASSLRAIDRPRAVVVHEPLPPTQRTRFWDLRSPKTKAPG